MGTLKALANVFLTKFNDDCLFVAILYSIDTLVLLVPIDILEYTCVELYTNVA